MAEGLPYDSDEGRAYAAALTALMGGEAYAASAVIAQSKGPFAGYHANAVPFAEVMETIESSLKKLTVHCFPNGCYRSCMTLKRLGEELLVWA